MKFKILATSSLSQMQMWLNQYNTNSGGTVEIVSPMTFQIVPNAEWTCIIKYKSVNGE